MNWQWRGTKLSYCVVDSFYTIECFLGLNTDWDCVIAELFDHTFDLLNVLYLWFVSANTLLKAKAWVVIMTSRDSVLCFVNISMVFL